LLRRTVECVKRLLVSVVLLLPVLAACGGNSATTTAGTTPGTTASIKTAPPSATPQLINPTTASTPSATPTQSPSASGKVTTVRGVLLSYRVVGFSPSGWMSEIGSGRLVAFLEPARKKGFESHLGSIISVRGRFISVMPRAAVFHAQGRFKVEGSIGSRPFYARKAIADYPYNHPFYLSAVTTGGLRDVARVEYASSLAKKVQTAAVKVHGGTAPPHHASGDFLLRVVSQKLVLVDVVNIKP
jgi:hypothetical protein